MKILYVSLEPLNSGSSASTCSVMNLIGLTRLGHEVEVLSIDRDVYKNRTYNQEILDHCQFSLVSQKGERKVDESMKASEVTKREVKPCGLSVRELAMQAYRKLSLYNYTYFYLKKVSLRCLKSSEYDVVISTSDPVTSHKAVAILKREGLKTNKWIQHWGDPMADDINRKNIWPTAIVRLVEQSILKQADKVVYVSPFTAEKAKCIFNKLSGRMTYVIPASEFNKQFEPSSGDIVRLAYCGLYYSETRDVLPLYDAVCNAKGCYLTIAGSTDVELDTVPNVKVMGYVSHDIAVKVEGDSDAIVCILNKCGTQIPAKLYYYFGTNKQIIVIYEDQNKRIVDFLNTFNRFMFARNDRKSIEDCFEILRKNRTATASDYLSPENVAKRLLE
ncbi:MAG: hypothetical protein PHY12_00260 [Eubacteriales bacterium]|nr:hypothetical protein [Eubacteriales bacterium]